MAVSGLFSKFRRASPLKPEPVPLEAALREISSFSEVYLSVLILGCNTKYLVPSLLQKIFPHLVLGGEGGLVSRLLERESFDVGVRAQEMVIGSMNYPGLGSLAGDLVVRRLMDEHVLQFSMDASRIGRLNSSLTQYYYTVTIYGINSSRDAASIEKSHQ